MTDPCTLTINERERLNSLLSAVSPRDVVAILGVQHWLAADAAQGARLVPAILDKIRSGLVRWEEKR